MCSRPGTAGTYAAAAAAAAAAWQAELESSTHTNAYSMTSTDDPEAAGRCSSDAGDIAEVLDEASTVLDYRSAHLRSFMEAVHAAAQSRGQGSSMTGLAGGSLAGRELLGNTISTAGVAGR
jgi:hypothetical protein